MTKDNGKRSRRGDGSVYRTADGRLRASVPVTDPLTGRTRRVYLSAKTDAEMRQKVQQARQDSDRLRKAPTFADYSASWLLQVRHRIAPRTFRSYSQALRTWAVPHIGGVELSRLTVANVERMMAELAEEGKSPGSIGNARKVTSHVLADAERQGIVPRNVARLARPPRSAAPCAQALTAAEASRLAAVARTHGTVGSLALLALATGLRRGEMLALRWEDVTGSTLTVRSGKTERSQRTIGLPALAREALERERANGSPYVFTGDAGAALNRCILSKRWNALRVEAGFPSLRLHDLRHTAATLLLGAGVPVTDVSAMLGHASAAITLRVYAHVIPGGQERTAAAMDAALGVVA